MTSTASGVFRYKRLTVQDVNRRIDTSQGLPAVHVLFRRPGLLSWQRTPIDEARRKPEPSFYTTITGADAMGTPAFPYLWHNGLEASSQEGVLGFSITHALRRGCGGRSYGADTTHREVAFFVVVIVQLMKHVISGILLARSQPTKPVRLCRSPRSKRYALLYLAVPLNPFATRSKSLLMHHASPMFPECMARV